MAFKKETGANIEVFCLEPHDPIDYNMAFAATQNCEWHCMVGNLRKWKTGSLHKTIRVDDQEFVLSISRIKSEETSHIIRFEWENTSVNFGQILESVGNIPIPPYLNRDAESSDLKTYQTIYSKHKGSVAAPTAGLHFTQNVFDALQSKNIKRHEVTLHVGAGTFKPVQTENVSEHAMHNEQFIITKDTIVPLLENIEKITAVGTTSVRTLESLYWLGVKALEGTLNTNTFEISQWDAYELPQNHSVKDCLEALNDVVNQSDDAYVTANTSIMIVPGYNFKLVKRLITNFHQPKSTLLLLIAAFIGADWHELYDYAIGNDFRFLSYGDSCLLIPEA